MALNSKLTSASATEPESEHVNVADRLSSVARLVLDQVAVACPGPGKVVGHHSYATCTFRELVQDTAALARGLVFHGVKPGDRIVLLVKPGIEFVKLVFGLLQSGATTILIDPGMGRKHLVDCLAAAEPDGFVAIGAAQGMRVLFRRRFPKARINVTVGRRWFWGGATYAQVLEGGRYLRLGVPATRADDPAAIIFTSGSTGPPKGVLYTHRMFDTQASEIQRQYEIDRGGVDLACFALFGLFNATMGVTTVFPDMDFSRPASADPRKLLAAANDWQVTQAFASPAVWDHLSRHGEATGERIPTLRRIFSCGAPVPADVLKRTLSMVHPAAEMHTPYGATESLPVATIEANEVLDDTAEQTARGAGVCVGRKFDSIDWRVIRISEEPIETIEKTEELPPGEIGELIVRGPQVSPEYSMVAAHALRTGRLSDQSAPPTTSPSNPSHANAHSKIPDGGAVWHRMGDVGYLDERGRFWYCGRKSHRVKTAQGTLFTECCEAIFNQHPKVRRSALVGVPCAGTQLPAIVVELQTKTAGRRTEWNELASELRKLAAANDQTRSIVCFFNYAAPLPIDVRHNAKINREALAVWAAKELSNQDLRHVLSLSAQGVPNAVGQAKDPCTHS